MSIILQKLYYFTVRNANIGNNYYDLTNFMHEYFFLYYYYLLLYLIFDRINNFKEKNSNNNNYIPKLNIDFNIVRRASNLCVLNF